MKAGAPLVAMPSLPVAVSMPRLPATVPRSGVSDVARLALRQLLGDVDRQIADAFRDGGSAETLVRARADAVERVLVHVFIACVGNAAAVALYAVGGFGRSELFPHSDVDLLVLAEVAPRAPVARALESFFTCLWDIGLKPGHALRTLVQCRELAAQDATVYTSLLDARLISGIDTLEPALAALVADPTIWPAEKFLAAKRVDRDQRHARFDDTAYNLEPNLKDGPGGLRSLQLMAWLGRRLFDAPSMHELVLHGLISSDEAHTVEQGRDLLWRIRFALHLIAGRAEERLLFDYQRELARRFAFSDEHGNLGVEQFMQAYYRAAIAIERLSEEFLQRCEEAVHPLTQSRPVRLSIDFVHIDGYLDSDAPDLFDQRPAALIDLFRVWIEHAEIRGLRAGLVRRIHEALYRIGADLAFDDEVNVAFARLLRKGAAAVDALARMNQLGVLAAYLPAFGRVVGRMQYDLFHVYTVDEHTLRVLRIVARFAHAETSSEFSNAHALWERLPKPELLLLAALFHDIAKGRGGDHSELGEREAREFCTRLELSPADIDLVGWLVRWHLLMSVTAQRQDITDPDVVHRFAVNVADWERLDYLYLLTMADITGTSQKLWNSWKDRLLADLYISARYMLRGGLEQPPHADERVRECQALAREILDADAIDDATVDAIWADFPRESFLRFTPQQLAWQTAGIARAPSRDAPLVLIEPRSVRGGTEIFVYVPDRDGLFATVTGVLDRLRLSVQDARVVTSRSGMSLDSFVVLDTQGQPLSDAAHTARLQRALDQALTHGSPPPSVNQTPARSLRHFHIPPRIVFDQDAGSTRTRLALVCSDRPGLLAGVAQIFRARHVRVHDARIATFGERVEDFFLLSDEKDRPLDNEACDALRENLMNHIDVPPQFIASTNARESHAST